MFFFSRKLNESLKTQGNKTDKFFFFYPQKLINENKEDVQKLIDECEKLARQCDELKVKLFIEGFR